MGPAVHERDVTVNGLRIHLRECGTGTPVVLCHGFPETSYAWRHQLIALAGAGFHAVAPDQRGYGGTESPAGVDAFTILDLVGDIVGLVNECGLQRAVIVGHDWGGPVAWTAALLRPDLFRGVIGLGVPLRPRAPRPPTSDMPRGPGAQYYQLYFQAPGVAERELELDVRRTIASTMYALSASAEHPWSSMVPDGGGFLSDMWVPRERLTWLSKADLDLQAQAFAESGFTGPLNWYRNIDRNWALLAPFDGLKVTIPSLVIAGAEDVFVQMPAMRSTMDSMPERATRHAGTRFVAGAGHWLQQEKPAEVSGLILDFLTGLTALRLP